MAKLLKLRRGTDTQHSTFTGAEGEVTVNTTNDSLHVHDGATAGGHEVARADLSNVSGTTEGAITVNGNLNLADNNKARFGTGNDLEIFHDGTHSYVKDIATGGLRITTDGPDIALQKGLTENLARFIPDGACELYHDNSQKLATTSTGIDVTGTVTCDGLTSDDSIVVNSGIGTVFIRDNNSSGTASQVQVAFRDSGSTDLGQIGYLDNANSSIYIKNSISGYGVIFGTNNTARCQVNADGHFVPNTNNTYDLGTSSLQWKDAYFDGTVNCDAIVNDGPVTVRSSFGSVYIDDTDNTGSGAQSQIVYRDSAGTVQGKIGYLANNNQDLYIANEQAAPLVFTTNGASRALVDANGHFLPSNNNTYDLGSSGNRWRNAYFAGDVTFSNDQRFPTVPQSYQTVGINLTAAQAGTVVDTNSGVTVPASVFAVGNIVTIYNRDSSATITITQGTGLTMRLVGDGGTGNRTLDPYGMATIWFRSGTDCTISGIGVN